MIRATELSGRPVVDIDAAEKIGTIDKMIPTVARWPGLWSHAPVPGSREAERMS